jgi:AcrR family transcriptional regulator
MLSLRHVNYSGGMLSCKGKSMEQLQPKSRERERRRQQIMRAARQIFIDKGYGDTTMREIADAADLGTSTIYLYFKNKEDLYASLSVRLLQYFLIRLDRIKSEVPASPGECLQNLKTVMLDLYDYDPPILMSMFKLQSSQTLRNISSDLLTEMNDSAKKILGKMGEILKQGANKDCIDHLHAVTLADILWGLFAGVILKEGINTGGRPGVDSVHQKFQLAFNIFVRGINRQGSMHGATAI